MSLKARTIIFAAISMVLVLTVVLVGCVAPAPAPEEAEEKEPIVIGAVFNQTGWMAAYDGPPRLAAFLAVDVLNDRGGIMGRPVELIELEGHTDPATVGNAARQLIEQGADIIIAPCDFDIGAPASQAAQEAGLVGTSLCASSPLYGSEVLAGAPMSAWVWTAPWPPAPPNGPITSRAGGRPPS
ncbi:MAG: hypothetical protein MAG451_01150 [Anaerolineales bacterium]|nr:hypothetical protein [Anaerolineales bacterium]